MKLAALGIAASLLAGCLGSADDPTDDETSLDKHVLPTRSAVHADVATGNGITYHGGSVMTSSSGNTVYYIWYGGWTNNTAVSLLETLAKNIGGSSYFNINTTYTNGSNTPVTNAIHFGGATTDNYSHGKSLTDANVESIVASAITSGRLPKSSNAVYFVLTSKDVDETSGFCSQYCGWHDNATISSTKIKYAFVGNAARCPADCAEQTTKSPNGNVGADAMASILAHELEETVTDPLGTAWYDSQGEENGDKCAWTYGTEHTASNGSKYNVTLGGKEWLIQQNWVNASGGKCAMSH
jgi:hypothetical protein